MSKFIIVKYAAEPHRSHTYAPDYKFTQGDSAHHTHTARVVGLNLPNFQSEAEGRPWLEKMIEANPSVGYALIQIED